ncbi:proline/serine-rich coiled-coil protein 1 isoform X4 [Coturnix japonica]|uniref:proline/serine-rich coiled-coil protein 1 isoform X4 n=1 Tax=Coturnix japonica TaxID=93934 RepID=UPI000776C23C|nr:proline/serine-rich coiled-coil protein 1 isoform X4 [Coturnix japonica]
MMEERDVQFITEEKLDFSILSPSDSREDDDDDEPPPGGTNGRWSPLSGAGLEEMVREATRLAAQLQQSHLSPLPPSPGGGSPRSPRRETFVVKDSPVRALLPTVPAANVPKEPPRCQPPPRGAPSSRGAPSPSGAPRPCPPRGALARGKSEPLRAGTAAKAEEQHCHPPNPSTPCQSHHQHQHCPQKPPPPTQCHPQTPRPGCDIRGCTRWEGAAPDQHSSTQRCPPRGGGCLQVQTWTPQQPPAAPPQDGSQQHPTVTASPNMGTRSHEERGMGGAQ